MILQQCHWNARATLLKHNVERSEHSFNILKEFIKDWCDAGRWIQKND